MLEKFQDKIDKFIICYYFKNIAKMLCSFYLPINVYILLSSGIISVGDT